MRHTIARVDYLRGNSHDVAIPALRLSACLTDGFHEPAAPLTRPFIERAQRHGIRRIVLLSGRGVDVPGYTATEAGVTHIDGEDAVRASGLEWTILRPAWFAQNFSEGFFADFVRSDDVRLPAGEAGATFVDAEDIADVSVAALLDDGHVGQAYELSGPRSVTVREVSRMVSEATGRQLTYTPVSIEEFVTGLTADGWIEPDARGFAEALHPLREGLDTHHSDGIGRALQRRPRTFEKFITDAAETGVWRSGPAAGV